MPQPLDDTSLDSLISDYKACSNRQVIKNLVVLSVGCLLAFLAYDGLVMLQSTINQESGIGVISVAVQFAVSCITALLLPEYLFGKIGCKAVIAVCLVLFVPYIASNFYPHWSLMMPASVLIGLANSLYWAAQSAYLNHLSILYCWNWKRNKMVALSRNSGEKSQSDDNLEMMAQDTNKSQIVITNPDKEIEKTVENNMNIKAQCPKKKDIVLADKNKDIGRTLENNKKDLNGKELENSNKLSKFQKLDIKMSEQLASTTARFFGVHGLIYQTCHIWGNLLSFYVLRIGVVEEESHINNTDCACGVDFSNNQKNCSTKNLMEPRDDLRNILIGVFVAISVLSVVCIAFFLDELKKREKNVTISWEHMTATCKQIKDKRQLLLIPMSLNIGVMQGFVMGDFTKEYVACAWGVHHVGLATACLGAALALASSLSGYLVKLVGRRSVFLVAKALNVAVVVILLLWKPTSSEKYMFFILSAMFGAIMATFWSQLRAFYGVLFKKKEGAAFANYQLWHAIGMAMTFAYSNFLRTSVKIYIYLAFSTVGMIGYLWAEKLHSRENLSL